MGAAASAGGDELRVQVTPPWPFRLQRHGSFDGLTRIRNGVLQRLVHIGEAGDRDARSGEQRPVLVRVAQLSGSGDVLFGATPAEPEAIERIRRALWVDLDLKPFHDAYRDDPWIGAAVRRDPTVRPMGRPYAFEALTAAITEQLIESGRAAQIQRRIHGHYGPRVAPGAVAGADRDLLALLGAGPLRDSASAAVLAAASPAQLESFDLAARRAITLVRVAREVAAGRIDLEDRDPDAQAEAWSRLRRIPNIGSWTVEMTALVGQGRIDQVPHGDLGFVKLAGRLASGGDPRARASEDEVRELFARFGEWKGIAGAYALRSGGVSKNAMLV